MRLFFALMPEQKTCLEIISFRENALPPFDQPVPIGNLHMTLAFLGEIEARQLETLYELAGSVTAAPFEILLDELGYFPKPSILWIGARTVPPALTELASKLRSVARQLQRRTDKQPFLPHLTIARNCKLPPPAGAMEPAIRAGFSSFCLVESTLQRDGAHYRSIGEWTLPLAPP